MRIFLRTVRVITAPHCICECFCMRSLHISHLNCVCMYLDGSCDWMYINSSPPSAAYMRKWITSAFVQIKACSLFGAKPLSKPMLGYYQLDPWEQNSEIWIKIQNLSFTKNSSEDIVCEMTAIMFGGRWVNVYCKLHIWNLVFILRGERNRFRAMSYSLTNWGQEKMAASFIWYIFSLKIFVFWFKFHCFLFPRVQLTIWRRLHWIR